LSPRSGVRQETVGARPAQPVSQAAEARLS
jgi:hypothetical protein